MRVSFIALAAAVSLSAAAPALAAPVPNGTVSSVATFNPTINLTSNPSTYSAMSGGTFEISGTGGFSTIGGTTGTLNGILTFSNTVGAVLPEALTNFFVFSDNQGGNYNFSTTSVQTNSFVNNPGTSTSGTLYVLGNLIDSNLNFLTLTPASLSIQFNSTGGSAYSSALTLAVPPAMSAVPEAATWAMMIVGLGMVGGSLRRRRNVTTRVSFA